MRAHARVRADQFWDGDLQPGHMVMIIHDVTVKADQLIDSINKFPHGVSVSGIFSLVLRKEWKGMERLCAAGHRLFFIISLDDNDIKKLLES